MNREIKFRTWDKKLSKPFEMSAPFNPFFYGGVFTANCVFMQSTGLSDLNNKEIFEGDIVKCGYGLGKVVWQAGCFMVQWLDDKEAYLEFVFSRKGMYVRKDDECFEIVGNIYENPEMLGVA